MRGQDRLALAFACISALGLAAGALADEGNNPVDENWWPSEFGAEDRAGATNWITPESRIAAAQLVREGKVITLGMPYHSRTPLFPGRIYSLTIPGGGHATHDLPWHGEMRQTFMDELVTAQIGQVGTQFDGLGHPMIRLTGREAEGYPDGDYFYNGVRLQDVGGPYGIRELGVENVGSFFTRGILIDMVALRGENLPTGYSITLEDYREALESQGVEDAEQGNVVLIRTGWNDLWRDSMDKTPEEAQAAAAEFNSGGPGASPELCEHLAERRVSMLGMDNWGIEPYDFGETPPDEIEAWAYCHMNLTVRRGIYLFENLDLQTLGEEGVYEFLFSWAPAKFVGATGAPGNPIAAY